MSDGIKSEKSDAQKAENAEMRKAIKDGLRSAALLYLSIFLVANGLDAERAGRDGFAIAFVLLGCAAIVLRELGKIKL